MKKIAADKIFFWTIIALVTAGVLIFTSASLGLLARQGASFSSVAFNHIVLGVGLGLVLMAITTKISYKFWKKVALLIFLVTLVLTASVFIPHVGFRHGGATRWILLGPLTLQPSEFLKFGYLVFIAAWLSKVKDKISYFYSGLVPFMLISLPVALIMLAQPDTDTFLVMFVAATAMLISAGAKIRHIVLIGLVSVLALAILAMARPYVKARITTFIDPSKDPQGAGYQIQQSLIAIGSGGIFGRGFGQSVQKFNFLPEPIGDSIFAVEAEEFGFIGSLALILLLTAFTLRGLRIASRAPDQFSGLLCVGIVILIITEAFINIGAMLGVLPLSGIPLIFISHGGTAMCVSLAEVGIILNISKKKK